MLKQNLKQPSDVNVSVVCNWAVKVGAWISLFYCTLPFFMYVTLKKTFQEGWESRR